MENLDPKAVQYANEMLWQQFPELNRRQLVMPQDANYAAVWMKHYKTYKQKQIAPTLPAKTSTAPSAPPPAPVPAVQNCPACAPCGAGSEACKNALEKGIDRNGAPIPPERHKRIVETNEKIRSRMKTAKFLGYPKAVDALDHWFNGCGKFKEIPADKTNDTKDEAWENHQTMLKQKLAAGLKSKLAYQLATVGRQNQLEVTMAWKGGGKTSGLLWSDDNLAYYGATIHSRVVYECKLIPSPASPAPPEARPFCYQCRAVSWISWVEDNYDFESGKGVPGLPTDAEMNELARYGCGANYPRSSKSWATSPDQLSQKVCFSNQEDLNQAAAKRHFMMQAEADQEREEAKHGALKSSGPAEEMSKP